MPALTLPAPARGVPYEVAGGKVRLHFHSGQWRAWDSDRRFVAILAGTRGGKTAFGPWWLRREVQRRGPGDYLAVTSNYALFDSAMRPAMLEVFEHVLKIGRYWGSSRVIELADPAAGTFRAPRSDRMWGRIMLRSAEAPGALEAATVRAAWLDEVGQDAFRVEAWEAVNRRVSIDLGRVLLTTTIYNFNWLKTQVYEPWRQGDPDIDVIHFDSTANPTFSMAEFERARAAMPEWRWSMQYRGRYERPAGMIYDSFLDTPYPGGHIVNRFPVPPHWPRFVGLDFGGTNTAAVYFAYDPQAAVAYAYREYHAGGLTATAHAGAMRRDEPAHLVCVGGSKSEGQWRDEFRAGGLWVYAPDIAEVEVGISRVYGAIKEGRVYWMDDLAETLRQLRSYSRKLDAAGRPTDAIDDKAKYHELDAVRYVLGWLFGPDRQGGLLGAAAGAGPASRWGAAG